jgi:uncharacterized membrane protein YfcA
MNGGLELLLFALCLALAGLTQSVTGFGFGLVALALLGWGMEVKEASVLLAPAGLVLNVYLFWSLRRYFSWAGLVPLTVACLLAVPLGGLLLIHVRESVLSAFLGGLMIYAAVQRFLAKPDDARGAYWHPVYAGVPCGLLGGLLTGAFGTGGPPLVSYLLNRPMTRLGFIASTQLLLALGNALRTLQFSLNGTYDRSYATLCLAGVVGVLLGGWGGLLIARKLSDGLLRRVVIGFLAVSGIYFLIRAW